TKRNNENQDQTRRWRSRSGDVDGTRAQDLVGGVTTARGTGRGPAAPGRPGPRWIIRGEGLPGHDHIDANFIVPGTAVLKCTEGGTTAHGEVETFLHWARIVRVELELHLHLLGDAHRHRQ